MSSVDIFTRKVSLSTSDMPETQKIMEDVARKYKQDLLANTVIIGLSVFSLGEPARIVSDDKEENVWQFKLTHV